MKRIFRKILLPLMLAIAAGGFASSAFATQITGSISLEGGYTTNTGNLGTATSFTSFSGFEVTGASGSFAGVTLLAPGSVTVTPFSFAPAPAGGIAPLFSTTSGIA